MNKNDLNKDTNKTPRKDKKVLGIAVLLFIVASLMIVLVKNSKNNDLVEAPDSQVEEVESNKDDLDSDLDKELAKESDFFFTEDIDKLNQVIGNGRPTLFSIGTKTCVYCEELKPILKELKDEYKEDVDIFYIDLEDNPDVGYEFPVQATPSTVIYTKEGKPIQVDEEIFKRYGVDGFMKNGGDSIDVSAFFGLKQKEDIKLIIDELLIENK